MLIVCVDVQYSGTAATVACVAAPSWEAEHPSLEITTTLTDVPAYEPGRFYRRELHAPARPA